MNRVIYVGGPYTDKCLATQEMRFELMNRYCAKLIRAGEIVFCGISMCHSMTKYGLPGDWSFWEKFDRFYLGICTEMHVIKAEGWKESVGLTEEIKAMCMMDKPVSYIDPDSF